MGADHLEWAKSQPLSLTGIDLTPRAIEHTQKRFSIYRLNSNIRVDDAEQLSFDDNSFDLVYSWGFFTIHQTPPKPLRKFSSFTARRCSTNNDLQQIFACRTDALVKVRASNWKALSIVKRHLCESLGKPWHESLCHSC
ncbi:MAG: class I SAM-dependent methyltransferase [Candidatus Omnitrophica bacterium]|nr:class I SAM-dependent methyltransferase [Candidatus Omnitrophota bacterium]